MGIRIFALSCLAILLSLSTVQSQDKAAKKNGPAPGNNPIPGIPMMPQINWSNGPTTGQLGSIAELKVPEGFKFIGQDQCVAFAKATGNLAGPNDMGVITPVGFESWYIVFEWRGVGYVKDDDKANLAASADSLLASLRQDEAKNNAARRAQGLDSLTVIGWAKPPFFDDQTKLLTWGTRIKSDRLEGITINYEARLLGRAGYMSSVLVVMENDFDKAVGETRKLLQGFRFNEGQRYGEFRAGDQVAGVGLTALIAGGAVGIAATAGWLPKLGKGLIAIVVVVGGAIASFFKRIFGSRSGSTE
jgi:uncharacterized membrane-anchored protein